MSDNMDGLDHGDMPGMMTAEEMDALENEGVAPDISVENFPKESGREDDPAKEWRNRHKTIAEAEDKNLAKWMPEELMSLAQRNVKS